MEQQKPGTSGQRTDSSLLDRGGDDNAYIGKEINTDTLAYNSAIPQYQGSRPAYPVHRFPDDQKFSLSGSPTGESMYQQRYYLPSAPLHGNSSSGNSYVKTSPQMEPYGYRNTGASGSVIPEPGVAQAPNFMNEHTAQNINNNIQSAGPATHRVAGCHVNMVPSGPTQIISHSMQPGNAATQMANGLNDQTRMRPHMARCAAPPGHIPMNNRIPGQVPPHVMAMAHQRNMLNERTGSSCRPPENWHGGSYPDRMRNPNQMTRPEYTGDKSANNEQIRLRPQRQGLVRNYSAGAVSDDDFDDDTDSDEDYYPGGKRRKNNKNKRQLSEIRRKAARKRSYSSDDDASASDFETSKKPTTGLAVLDFVGCPDEFIIDRIVAHKDFWHDNETGLSYPIDPGSQIEMISADTNESASELSTSETTVYTQSTPPNENCEKIRKYLTKWKGFCHLKNEYLTIAGIEETCVGGIKKLLNYVKKQNEYELSLQYLTDDEKEQLNIGFELQRQLDADALIAERIITNAIPKHVINPDASQIHYLVKWQSTPYDQATWETEDFLNENGFKALLDEFTLRESRINGPLSAHATLNQHDLSETSFTPYTSTPHYMGSKDENFVMRDYQITGLNWIVSRMKKDLSVLLADEMGLGKTAQTIAVIGHILFVEKLAGPILLIVPQSTMDNWLSEFKRWLPLANVVLYHGVKQAREIVRREELKVVKARPMSRTAYESFVSPRSRLTDLTPQQLRSIIANRLRYRCDVVITTPSIFQWSEDLQVLRNISWYMISVDEAHQLKNRESKRFKVLCDFRARYKLLLSGTPLHNNLDELWSLLHFMNPTIYATLAPFKARYSEIENTHSTGESKQAQLEELQKALSAIVIRRVKKDVLKSLPNKVEWILRVELSPIQEKLCQYVILRNYESLSKNTGGLKVTLQNICVELKKICNHPFLLQYQKDSYTAGLLNGDAASSKAQYNHDIVWNSGKMCLLHKLLARLKAKGHRVLIFSQMVRMLNILSRYLTLFGYKHQRLDGTMSRNVRKKAMDHFNAPDSQDFCFLLSTKAGGLGINLTSADTVIIYDSDWNPQNDLQAEARAHRIGQTKTVQIYRIVTKNTIEEDILERAKAKMVLDALVVQGLNTDSNMLSTSAKHTGFTREELSKILKFGATKLWSKGDEEGAENRDIDLDKILAEAEQQNTGSNRAADLLNSYGNISDFAYEAPKSQVDDKISWEKVVPLEERMKFSEDKERSNRKPRSKRSSIKLVLSDDEGAGDDDVVDEARVSRRKTTAKVKRATAATTKGSRSKRDPSAKVTVPKRKKTEEVEIPASPASQKDGADTCSDYDDPPCVEEDFSDPDRSEEGEV